MLEPTLPKRAQICSQCGVNLTELETGASFLYNKRKGLIRSDFCSKCLLEEQKQTSSKTAVWYWEIAKEEEKKLLSKSVQKKLFLLLETLFSKNEYTQEHEYEYTLLMILARARLIQKKRARKNTVSFIWERKEEDSFKQIQFISVPETISSKAYQQIQDLLQENQKESA